MSLILAAGCCCVFKLTPCFEPGDVCASYEDTCDTTPAKFTVTMSGITLNAGVTNCPGPLTSWTVNPNVGPNTTIVVNQDGSNPCLYGGKVAATGSWTAGGLLQTVVAYRVQIIILGSVAQLFVSYSVLDHLFAGSFATVFLNPSITFSCEAFSGNNNLTAAACIPSVVGAVNWSRGSNDDGSILIVHGDPAAGGRCPGGSAIFTNTDLSQFVDRIITIDDIAGSGVQDVCYAVSVASAEEFTASEVVALTQEEIDSITDCGTDCEDCCDDNCP